MSDDSRYANIRKYVEAKQAKLLTKQFVYYSACFPILFCRIQLEHGITLKFLSIVLDSN